MTDTTGNQPLPRQSSRSISRRTLLLGLGGLGIAGLGGGGIALWKYHHEHTATYVYTGYQGNIFAVAWSPDGKRIACGGYTQYNSSPHGTTHIWDALSGRNLFIYNDPSSGGEVKALAWAPDSKRLASAGEGDAYIWEDGLNTAPLATHREPDPNPHVSQQALAWSPDGTQMVSGGEGFPDEDPVAQAWSSTTGKALLDYCDTSGGVPGVLYGIAWSPDGQWIATSGFSFAHHDAPQASPTVQVWEAFTGKLIFTHRGPPGFGAFDTVAWSPNSKQIVVGVLTESDNHTASILDIASQKNILTYTGHAGSVLAAGWSPNGQWIATAGTDQTARIWNPTTGQTAFIYRGHTGNITNLSWSPDSKYVATGGFDNTVQIWQVNV